MRWWKRTLVHGLPLSVNPQHNRIIKLRGMKYFFKIDIIKYIDSLIMFGDMRFEI
jgi:hypothetical protein